MTLSFWLCSSQVEIKKLKSSNTYLPSGAKGVSMFTDKLSYLDAGGQQTFEAKIECTLQASYFQLLEEHLHIEVWDSSRFFLNTFLGYESVQLLDVAQGSINQSVNVYDKIERDGEFKKLMCTLNFKLVFEEIWDYMIKFIDWRTSNLEDRFQERPSPVNPKLEFSVTSPNVIANRA